MLYSEGGWKAEVELLSTERDEKGVKLTFRTIQTLLRPPYDTEALPQDGDIFTVYKSNNIKQHGWRLADF